MNIRQLKNIMKEINEPNEFELFADDLTHPLYWVFKKENIRIKTLYSKLKPLRKPTARLDVFINGLFISENDFIIENSGNDFYIKFIKSRFPELDRFGDVYQLDETDEIKVKGDIESIN